MVDLLFVVCRFKTITEVDNWKKSFQEWKEFNLDYGSIYPNGLPSHDIERNSPFQTSNNPMNQVAKNDNLLDHIQVEEDDDDDKGVRPLMKVCFTYTPT